MPFGRLPGLVSVSYSVAPLSFRCDGPMSRRISQSISLTPELDRFVQTLVASGRYQTASEVVRDGLRLLQERAMAPPASLARPPASSGGHDS